MVSAAINHAVRCENMPDDMNRTFRKEPGVREMDGHMCAGMNGFLTRAVTSRNGTQKVRRLILI